MWHFKILCALFENSDQFCMKDKHCIAKLENGRIYLPGPVGSNGPTVLEGGEIVTHISYRSHLMYNIIQNSL